MTFEKWLGAALILVCGVISFQKARDCVTFMSKSYRTIGTLIGREAPDISVEYTDASGVKKKTHFEMGYRVKTKRFMRVGRTFPLYVHKESKEVRIASFMAYWFDPVIYLIGVILGVVFIFRRPKTEIAN